MSLETHGKYYTNPFLPQLLTWLQAEGYELWYKDGSDSVYVRQGLLKPSLTDRFETKQAELAVSWKKFKRLFKSRT